MVPDRNPRGMFAARLSQAKEIARAAGKIASEEARGWDVFRWTVIILLLFNLLLLLTLCSSPNTEIESLEKAKAAYDSQVTALRSEFEQKISQVRAETAQAVAAMQAEVRKARRSPPEPRISSEPSITLEQPVPMPTRAPHR